MAVNDQSVENDGHDFRQENNQAPPRCVRCRVYRLDAPWEFVVTWDPESGALPSPILRLFRYRSTVEPGRATHQTDKGHGTHYVQAVEAYVRKYQSSRTDIRAEAVAMPCVATPPEGRTA